jgi:hypothetical protein
MTNTDMTNYDTSADAPSTPLATEKPFDPSALRGALSKRFLQALADDFARHGARTFRMLRRHRRQDYLKLIAALLPKEYRIKEIELAEISDEELAAMLDMLRKLTGQQEQKPQDQGGPLTSALK